jgi:hypothetical protein
MICTFGAKVMIRLTSALVLSTVLLRVTGCNSKTEPAPSEPSASVEPAAADESQSEIEDALSQLLEEDRKLTEAQRICPASGEPLGSMGPPIKLTVGDRSLFICCDGCETDAREKFDEHYAKLQKP